MGNHILRSRVPKKMAEQDCVKMEEGGERNVTTKLTVGSMYSVASPLANTVIKTKSSSGLSPSAILTSKIWPVAFYFHNLP